MIPSTPSFSALTGVHSMNELFPLEPAAEGYERIHERVGDYLPRNAELVLEPAALLAAGSPPSVTRPAVARQYRAHRHREDIGCWAADGPPAQYRG
jgi:hypothetical protein